MFASPPIAVSIDCTMVLGSSADAVRGPRRASNAARHTSRFPAANAANMSDLRSILQGFEPDAFVVVRGAEPDVGGASLHEAVRGGLVAQPAALGNEDEVPTHLRVVPQGHVDRS